MLAFGDLKPLDMLRIFEAERANLQAAAAMAVADARAAQALLARAQVSSADEAAAVVVFVAALAPRLAWHPSFNRKCCSSHPRIPAYLPAAGGAACCGAAL